MRPEDNFTSNVAKLKMDALASHVKRIRRDLQKAVVGQENAINTFAEGYFQSMLASEYGAKRIRPKATFLFAGPPGVGKTLLSETIANSLGLEYKVFDMSSFSHDESVIDFCGLNKSYKESSPGLVTGFVRENPKCVVVFDEIEKAHISVIHLFLQLLDRGRVKDFHHNEDVSFRDAIVILTTNAGRQLYEESESEDFSNIPRKVIINALKKDVDKATGQPFFPAAICSRFASGNVVMFNHMTAHSLLGISSKSLTAKAEKFRSNTGINVEIDPDVFAANLFAEGGNADARTVSGRVSTFFDKEIYEFTRLVSSEKTKTGLSDIKNIRFTVDFSRSTKDIPLLFRTEENSSVLLFTDEKCLKQCDEKISKGNIRGTNSLDEAIKISNENGINVAIIDLNCGLKENEDLLNIEDIESDGRALFKYMRDKKSCIPVYVLAGADQKLTDEERVSLLRQGVRGILMSKDPDYIEEKLEIIDDTIHYQESINQLARTNKIVSFETAQIVSDDGSDAEIRLFDFKTSVAVDSEDMQDILSPVSIPNVKFDKILGAREAKKELEYFVDYLKDPKKYAGTGVKAPRGLLFYGPPGTGKTMLAKATASEAGLPFIATEGNAFIQKIVGAGPEKVHEIFRKARKYAPSILFIDEIDAIGKERRGAGFGESSNEETLTAFLAEMDGFSSDPSKPVFVLAATNFEVESGRSKSLDGALVRRFDRSLKIDLPDKRDREKFIRMKMEDNPALRLSDEKIDNIALRSMGMSIAELESVVELALRSTIRERKNFVSDKIFEEAFETFNNGEIKVWDSSQLERVARHEAGHTLMSYLAGETPAYLTIVARGDHGGYMQHAEKEGKAIYTKDELLAKIRTSLGGRAAEIVYYGKKEGTSTGAHGDLVNATNIAKRIICAFGMDDDFGLAVVDETASGSMSEEVRRAVNSLLKEQMDETIRLITENKEKIDALVEALINKNHMTGIEIEEIMK